jgi:hypothetical protein
MHHVEVGMGCRGFGHDAHLDDLVPTSRDNHGVHRVGRESNARDPLGVTILGNVELAFTQGVPQLDGSVSRGGNDLSVVGREGNGQDVTGVSDESSGGLSGVQVPQSQSLVPRGGKSKLSVRGDDNVGDEVVVTVQNLLGVTVFTVFTGELPDNDLLVCGASASATSSSVRDLRTSGTGQDHVGVFRGRSDRGDGTAVTDAGTLVDDLLRHFETAEEQRISKGRRQEKELCVPLGYLSREIRGARSRKRVLMNEGTVQGDRNFVELALPRT